MKQVDLDIKTKPLQNSDRLLFILKSPKPYGGVNTEYRLGSGDDTKELTDKIKDLKFKVEELEDKLISYGHDIHMLRGALKSVPSFDFEELEKDFYTKSIKHSWLVR